MLLDARYCPEDRESIAEACVIGALDDSDTAAFEEHLLVCRACRAAVAEAVDYVTCMRLGAAHLRNPVN